LIKHFLYRSQ